VAILFNETFNSWEVMIWCGGLSLEYVSTVIPQKIINGVLKISIEIIFGASMIADLIGQKG
jgi:hypothetical protein